MQTEEHTNRGGDRRSEDRRNTEVSPLPFPDRRKSDRRDGTDRRTDPA